MQAFCGETEFLDITKIFEDKLKDNNNVIKIPAGRFDRSNYFNSPKCLKQNILVYYHDKLVMLPEAIAIDVPINCLETHDIAKLLHKFRKDLWNSEGCFISDPQIRLQWIHERVGLINGSASEEYDEQLMVCMFLDKNSTVLELGGNYGRNSVVISTILTDDKRLVVMETDNNNALILDHNKTINGFEFNIECSALSKAKLCQKGWVTTTYDEKIPEDHYPVNTITFEQLSSKYNMIFDTIVADCEGALAQILKDYPSLLDTVHTLIVENDYINKEDKEFVDKLLYCRGFKLVYTKEIIHPDPLIYKDCFYQVFKKEL